MLIVTGATGRLGSLIVHRLLERVPADRIGVSVRDVRRAADLAERGVRVRAGDFTEPGALAHAFEGAERVLVISASIRGGGAFAANRRRHRRGTEAAPSASCTPATRPPRPTSLFPPQRVHAATEEYLKSRESPSPRFATVLRLFPGRHLGPP